MTHADANLPAGDHHDDHPTLPIAAIGTYLLVLTFATSSTLLLTQTGFWGPMTNILFVLMISVCKASLVIAFFMHLKYEQSWKYLLTLPPLLLAMVCIFALLPDVAFQEYAKLPWNAP